MLKHFTKQEKSWMMYDWANSAYSTIITAAVLPIFFKSVTRGAGINPNIADSYWGYGTAVASIIVALFAPILGTLGDYKNMKMRLFRVFLVIGLISTAALAFTDQWQVILGIYIITVIGFSGANIFYDAFLVDVTTEDKMDRVSSYGYAIGYIGGSTIPFVISIALIMFGEKIGIPVLLATQISFMITAVWWAVFSIPMLKNVKQIHYIEHGPKMIVESINRLRKTFGNVKKYRKIFLFLLAYFFYIDGVGTIIRMATVYGDSIGIGSETMLLALMVIQIVAFPCAIIFGRLAERFGSSKMIMSGIFIYMLICILGYRMTTALEFWGIAMLVASAQGGIQAISRSHYGKMIPKENANEFFGIYDIFGKFSAIMGPTLFALSSQLTGSSRFGVLSVMIQFIIGATIFMIAEKKSPQKASLQTN
ncbi:MFS transporter, UMF1 family [Natronincola peptidivorans]|uniref:MFS transporter, UMF1 family n=1 Tax=Natronincola peptidivorans TaxID=426128 RepID=A0A1I0GXZ7_9FIRM|nr:MFS transporter [Natronincola peptidivorans]SET76077.1 MFS transporter, UMF1 family [Natronincola peptidivorans]